MILLPIMAVTAPAHAEGNKVFEKKDGKFKIRIEASQWVYRAYDLNRLEDEGKDITTMTDAQKAPYVVEHRIEFPDAQVGDQLEFHLVTRDVQHGFSINELGIAQALIRPVPPAEFGQEITVKATLKAPELGDDNPNRGVTYSAFCHIFCGLGHPDMKIKLVLGGGAFEVGPIVFWAAFALNGLIFALTLRSIITKIEVLPENKPTAS